jgi:hypothetical protein
MSTPFTKIDKFLLNTWKKVFNLSTDQLKVALTNTLPTASTVNQYSDLTAPLATTNLSGATPFNLTTTSLTQTSGVTKLIIADLTLTATGAVGPFQYIVLYDDTATNKELIGFYDFGSPVTMANTNTFLIDFDNTNGVIIDA